LLRIHVKLDTRPTIEGLDAVKNQIIAIEAQQLTFDATVKKIMPANWRVLIDVDSELLLSSQVDFISRKQRDLMLQDLLYSFNFEFQYFYEFYDDKGQHTPLLVITSRQGQAQSTGVER